MRFVVKEAALDFPPSPSVSPVSNIPPTLHTRLHPHAALTRRTNGHSLGTFQTDKDLSEVGEPWIENYFFIFLSV